MSVSAYLQALKARGDEPLSLSIAQAFHELAAWRVLGSQLTQENPSSSWDKGFRLSDRSGTIGHVFEVGSASKVFLAVR